MIDYYSHTRETNCFYCFCCCFCCCNYYWCCSCSSSSFSFFPISRKRPGAVQLLAWSVVATDDIRKDSIASVLAKATRPTLTFSFTETAVRCRTSTSILDLNGGGPNVHILLERVTRRVLLTTGQVRVRTGSPNRVVVTLKATQRMDTGFPTAAPSLKGFEIVVRTRLFDMLGDGVVGFGGGRQDETGRIAHAIFVLTRCDGLVVAARCVRAFRIAFLKAIDCQNVVRRTEVAEVGRCWWDNGVGWIDLCFGGRIRQDVTVLMIGQTGLFVAG